MSSLSPDQKLAAYFLGRRIAGQRRKQDRVPVAYLYNGEELPPLPNTAKDYLCAYIQGSTDGGGPWNLYLMDAVPTYGKYLLNKVLTGYDNRLAYTRSNDTWKLVEDLTPDTDDDENRVYVKRQVWSNYDIYDADGNLWLAATDPVPVYEWSEKTWE